MMEKLKIKNGILLVATIISMMLLIGFSSAVTEKSFSTSTSTFSSQYYSPGSFSGTNQQMAATYWPALSNPDKCEAGTDFVMFIQPGGCSPTVVRSDLLEEQNVPIFCKVDIIKINPLIDVSNIKSVKYTGEMGKYVAGISFHPNRAAIYSQKAVLDNPFINDVGYVVIVLKRIPVEKDMPESVKLNVTGVLTYDAEGILGPGKTAYYLNPTTDDEWKLGDAYKENAIFNGRGYLRAENLESNQAEISIYRDKEEKLTSFRLKKGETSANYYMPGFYCKAGVQIRLDDIGTGVERVNLEVDGADIWLTKGETFLDGKCRVSSINIEKKESTKEVGVKEILIKDLTFKTILDGSIKTPFRIYYGTKASEYVKIDSVLRVSGTQEISVGNTKITIPSNQIYLIGGTGGFFSSSSIIYAYGDDNARLSEILVSGAKKSITTIKEVTFEKLPEKREVTIRCKDGTHTLSYQIGNKAIGDECVSDDECGKGFCDAGVTPISWSGQVTYIRSTKKYCSEGCCDVESVALAVDILSAGTLANYYFAGIEECDKLEAKFTSGKRCSEVSSTETTTEKIQRLKEEIETLSDDTKENYYKAKEYAEDIKSFYGDVANPANPNEIIAARALYQLGILANELGLVENAKDIFNRIINEYPNNPYANSASLMLVKNRINAPSSNYANHKIRLIAIETPGREEASADFTINKLSDTGQPLPPAKQVQINEELGEGNFKILGLEQYKVNLVYQGLDSKGNRMNEKFTLNTESDESDEIIKTVRYGDYELTLDRINFKAVAKVSVIANMPKKQSEANFPVEIGIEKRAIKLSPGKIKERIENLNKTIEKWEGIVNNLGNAVKAMKGACFATSAILIAKNFISNLGGGAIARQAAMPAWNKKCKAEAAGNKAALDECLSRNSAGIEKDVGIYKTNIENINSQLTTIEKNSFYPNTETVNRTKAAADFLSQNFQGDMYYEVYTVDPATKEISKEMETKTILYTNLKTASLTDLRDLKLNLNIQAQGSGASEIARSEAGNRIQTIANRLLGQQQSLELYDKTDNGWVSTAKVIYFDRGAFKGLAHLVPLSGTYANEKGTTKSGFYVLVQDQVGGKGGGYSTSGDIKEFWIQNIGADGQLDKDRDPKTIVDFDSYSFEKGRLQVLDLSPEETSRIIQKAEANLKLANRNYGKNSYPDENGQTIYIDRVNSAVSEPRCQDFMSASDCKLLFNVCDPVMCPASRCDLGGKMRVDNVIASGIIGSIALCLPNYKEVYVPVCLSGIYAGLDAYLSILRNHRDCLQEQLATGRVTAFCDETQSIYLCELFWRQGAPFMNMLIQKIVDTSYGGGMKGGGEYLAFQAASDNADKSIDYFKNYYAVDSMKAFTLGSTSEIGTEFCKMFISAGVPSNKKMLDNLLQPTSPVQFSAWFDEIPYSEVTSPPSSQYKVFYHIYAGRDEGINYQVYLKSPPESAYIQIQDYIIVDSGFIPMGGYASQTKDLTAPAGYKEVCVRINGKDECGFKRVTTSFAMNYAADKYAQGQTVKKNITSKSECIGGTAFASEYDLTRTLNPQEALSGAINPNLDKSGIVRICSTTPPGATTGDQKWVDVGYCDDASVRCWLDEKSVQNVIKNKNILDETLGAVDGTYGIVNEVGIINKDDSDNILKNVRELVANLENAVARANNPVSVNLIIESIKSGTPVDTNINVKVDLIDKLKKLEEKGYDNSYKAQALYFQFKIYEIITRGLQRTKVVKESKIVQGNNQDNLGKGWTAEQGTLIILGNARDSVGNSMSGGEIIVQGNAGDFVGDSMTGGRITVEGNAAGGVGKNMGGGNIIIQKNAGSTVGGFMNGGTIIIEGSDVGGDIGYQAKKGTMSFPNIDAAKIKEKLATGTNASTNNVQIFAKNNEKVWPVAGAEVTAGTATSPPTAETQVKKPELTVVKWEGNTIDLRWTKVTLLDVYKYEIWQVSKDGISYYKKVGQVDSKKLLFAVTSPEEYYKDKSYCYQVAAYTQTGALVGEGSNIICAQKEKKIVRLGELIHTAIIQKDSGGTGCKVGEEMIAMWKGNKDGWGFVSPSTADSNDWISICISSQLKGKLGAETSNTYPLFAMQAGFSDVESTSEGIQSGMAFKCANGFQLAGAFWSQVSNGLIALRGSETYTYNIGSLFDVLYFCVSNELAPYLAFRTNSCPGNGIVEKAQFKFSVDSDFYGRDSQGVLAKSGEDKMLFCLKELQPITIPA